MAVTPNARMRFLYCLNILVVGMLAIKHLTAPVEAAGSFWGAPIGASLSPPLALPLVGSFYGAVALASVLGLRSPLKFSPVFLMQVLYKFVFLGFLAGKGQLSLVLTQQWAPFTAYLLPLFACAPWGHLLGDGSARAKVE